MCGIAGMFGRLGLSAEEELTAMGEAIVHRGPDSNGTWIDDDAGIGLVHQRLAVVDLSETGQQPMVSSSGRYVIVFNGEIYNHETLRSELDSNQSVVWRGSSDTETLLATIEQFGLKKAISKWVGMFAFALWDRQERSLTFGRDRFGEKPLYYGKIDQRVVFASEIRSFLALDGYQPEIDLEALTLFFRHHYVPVPYSILKGINKLSSGSIAMFKSPDQEPVIETYWSAPDVARTQSGQPFDGDLSEATNEVERLLRQSIAGQSIADVPVGAFLSGGIDSSTVVALMQQVAPGSVNTFSVGFDDSRLNEAAHAKAVAKHIGTEHTEYYLTGSDARDLIPEVADFCDEPFADSSQLPTFAVSRLARQKVTVSLSGDGGDELFGGYLRHAQAGRAIGVRRRMGAPGRLMASALLRSPVFRYNRAGQASLRFLPKSLASRAQPLNRALQIMSQQTDAMAYLDMLSFWRSPYTPVSHKLSPEMAFLDANRWLSEDSPQSAVQMLDVLNFLPDDILVKVDRCGMQVSLESRIPMLDHRLAEFVWSLPTEFRANAAEPKRILFDIACRHIPRELLDRPKKGFGIPLASWLRGSLKDWAEDLLDAERLSEQGLLDSHCIRRTWQEFLAGDDYKGDLLWGVLMFQSWYARAFRGR